MSPVARLKAARLPALPAAWRTRLDAARHAGAARWKRLSGREQRLLVALATVLLLALLVQWALLPAWQTIQRSGTELTRLRAQAAAVDAVVQEAQALQRAVSGRIAAQQMPRELAASLTRAGLAPSASVTTVADAAEPSWDIALASVPAAALMNWIAQVPSQLRLSVRSAHLERSRDAAGKPVAARISGTLRLQATGDQP